MKNPEWNIDQAVADYQAREAAASAYCDQGHPAHNATFGCGPCQDERDAGLGERAYAQATR